MVDILERNKLETTPNMFVDASDVDLKKIDYDSCRGQSFDTSGVALYSLTLVDHLKEKTH